MNEISLFLLSFFFINLFLLKLFACSFYLGPFIFLIWNLIDIRVDAKRILWLYRRPVAYKAQDIGKKKKKRFKNLKCKFIIKFHFVFLQGMFQYIFQFINIAGIVTNAFLIAFTSKWSKDNLKSLEERLTFVVIYEVLFEFEFNLKWKLFLN